MRSLVKPSHLKAELLVALAVCLAILLAYVPINTAAMRVRLAGASAPTPDRQLLGRLLWPGTFDAAPGESRVAAGFTASGRRYTAVVRSDALSVGSSPSKNPKIEIRVV